MISGSAAVLLLALAAPAAGTDTLTPDPSAMPHAEGFTPETGWTPRKLVSAGVTGALVAGSLVDSYYAWWKDSSRPFAFHSEGWFDNPHLGIDKLGHLFTSHLYFHTVRNILLWGGHEPGAATWWGAGVAGFFALSIEVGDGVSEYAFDYQDLVFNAAGIGYGLLQTEVPVLQNFTLKWSYVPEGGYRFPPRFTEHYDAHIYWLAVNVHGILPDEWKSFWPEILQVAGGYSVGEGVTRREFALALDLRLRVLEPSGPDARLLLRTLDHFHIPLPGVRFSPGRPPLYRGFLRN